MDRQDAQHLPDQLAGYATYLFAIRDECDLYMTRALQHEARLRWPYGYLARTGLTARRCHAAQSALSDAAVALDASVRIYEQGMTDAHLTPRAAIAEVSAVQLSPLR